MRKLVDLALEDPETFGVLSPAEKRIKEARRTEVALLQRLSKDDQRKKRQHSIAYQLRANRA